MVDMIILDLQMPELDGYETARRLRAGVHAATPIIAVTAFAMQGDKERALAVGFSSYLPKPVRLAHIREELARWSKTP
jgi:CheY-like chemotaxis protein